MTNNEYLKKTLKLSLQFDSYLVKNQELFKLIPNKSTVFFTVKGDSIYNRESHKLAKDAQTRHEKIIEARKEGRKWQLYPVSK